MLKKLALLIFLSTGAIAQDNINGFGGRIGLNVNFGSHINSLGIVCNAYYTNYFFQLNVGSSLRFSMNDLGDRNNYWSARNVLGLVLTNGKGNSPVDFQLDGLNHQTNHDFALGYNYIYYWDNSNTSQFSGGFSAHFKRFSIYHENDVFGGFAKDRFRTGHFYMSYRGEQFKLGTGINLWTGETKNSDWNRSAQKGMPNGYRDLSSLPYGKTSHGIAYISFVSNLPYNQNVHLRLGADSEQIRHIVQNRTIHDLIFLPKKVKRTTPHYPRINSEGLPVFDKKDIKPLKLYMQFGANNNWSE